MIKNVQLKPFEVDKICAFPAYVYSHDIEKYTLVATVPSGYKITLAKLMAGKSIFGRTTLSHVIFESYSEHGEKMSEAKVRVGGVENEFMAAKNAMMKAVIGFNPIVLCHFLNLLNGLGAYYQAVNPEISEYAVVSQRCH